MKATFLFPLIIGLFFVHGVIAQNPLSVYDNTQRLHIGLQTGYTGYHGDLSNNGSYFSSNKFSPPFGVLIKYSLSYSFSLRAAVYWALLEKESRNRRFSNKINTIEIQPVLKLSNLSFLRHPDKCYLYGFTGIGTVHSNLISPTANPANPNKVLYKAWNLTVPVGLGVMYHLSRRIDLSVETGLRFSNTDSLDYTDYNEHYNRSFDHFSFTTVGIYYKLGKKGKIDHTDWIDPVTDLQDSLNQMKALLDEMHLYLSDKDGDGVPDISDLDLNTPRGVLVDPQGRPMDSDHDGIPDYKDAEVYSWPGTQVDTLGRMRDDDHDGVPNGRDKENNTASGAQVDVNGKALNLTTGATTGMNDFEKKTIEALMPAIYFEKDKDIILPEYIPSLVKVSTMMNQYPAISFDIVGNCDFSRNETYNQKLGLMRAAACRNYLVKTLGCDASRLHVKTNGAAKPLVPGKDQNLMLYNRRVNFMVADEGSTDMKEPSMPDKESGPNNKQEGEMYKTENVKVNAGADLARIKQLYEKDSFEAVLNGIPENSIKSADDIIEEYPGTPEANMAHYYAGAASLRLGKPDDAIAHLKAFTSKDNLMNAYALAYTGDAWIDKGSENNAEAVLCYIKAVSLKAKGFPAPAYLLKAGGIYMEMNNVEKAMDCYETIKRDYPKSNEAKDIDRFLKAGNK